MLRFGDGTPFPYVENVLGILEDAVAACAEMFAAAADLDRQREEAAAARRVVDDEAARLVTLEQAIVQAAKTARGSSPSLGASTAVSERAAQRAIGVTQRVIGEARKELDEIAAVQAAEPAWEPFAKRVQSAAARFFERQSLPSTCWVWQWDASGAATPPRAEATGHAAPFQVTFDLEISPVWRAPVRIGVLGAGIVLQLPARRMFGAPAVAATKLDPLFLVHAATDANGRTLLVRERATPSPGWRIRIPAQGAARCHLVDRDGNIDGPEFELARDEHLTRLWTAIETEVTTMHANRRAREVRLNTHPVTAVADITTAPRAILDVLGPIVRAIRTHSRMPGELVLKRDVADGVRAELFVSREAIVARYAELPPEYRRLFDDAGFARGLTEPPPDAQVTFAPRSGPRFARASQPMLGPPTPPPRRAVRPESCS